MMQNHNNQNSMINHALSYINTPLSWRLCKLRPNSKAPMLAEWNSPALTVGDSETAISIWNDSKSGMGLVHEASLTGAFDVDSLEWAEYAFAEFGISINELLEGYPRIKGREGRDKIIFSVPECLSTVKLVWPKQSESSKPITVFELRGKGGQDVLPPSIHPDTLEPYSWVVSPFEFKDGIPTAPSALLAIWKNWGDFKPQFEAACPWLEKEIVSYPPVTTRHVGRSDSGIIDKFNDAYDVTEILEFNGYKRKGKRWLSPTSSSGIPGVVVFDVDGKKRCFSHHASDPLNDGHAHDAFDLLVILGNAGNFANALESAASSLGIVLLPKQVEHFSEIDIEQLKANAKERKNVTKAAISTEFTPNLVLPVQKLQELSDWFSGLTDEPTPAISTAGAVAFGSVLTGRMYRSTEANWTALLMAVSGPSGVGKNYIKVGIERALIEAGLNALVAGDFYTHQAAVYSELRVKPCHICISDEFGENFLEARKNNNANKMTVFKSFKKAYSDSDHIYKSESYSKMSGKEIDTTPIVCPSLTLLGLTTPLQFYSEIKTSHIESGLINRFIVVNINKNDKIQSVRGDYSPSPALIDWMKDVRRIGTITLQAFDKTPTFQVVKFAPEAMRLFDKAKRDQDIFSSRLEGEHMDAMPARWRESSMRLATMLAACLDQKNPTITEELALWAINYVFGYGMQTVSVLQEGVGENDYQTQANAVLAFIASRNGVQDQELSRKFRGLKRKDRVEILTHLQEAELIYCQKETNGTGSRGREANIWRSF
jgi:hypothetical protein